MSAPREHTVRLSALKVVLHERCRDIRQDRAELAGGTCVALTGHVEAGACGGSWRNAWSYRQHMGMEPHNIRSGVRWMCGSELAPVVKKVRLVSGLDEVKKTWGKGFKALLRELEPQPAVRP